MKSPYPTLSNACVAVCCLYRPQPCLALSFLSSNVSMLHFDRRIHWPPILIHWPPLLIFLVLSCCCFRHACVPPFCGEVQHGCMNHDSCCHAVLLCKRRNTRMPKTTTRQDKKYKKGGSMNKDRGSMNTSLEMQHPHIRWKERQGKTWLWSVKATYGNTCVGKERIGE